MAQNGFVGARISRMQDMLAGHVASGQVPGLVTLVSRHDEVHVAAIGAHMPGDIDAIGNRAMQRDTIFRIASMTKPIIGAATMLLIEECKLRLDDSVDDLLPELSNRRVLTRLDSPLDDTVAAHRSITVRDLLTFRLGYGFVLAPASYPIQQAIAAAGLAPGPIAPDLTPDEYLHRLGALPLAHQPGEQWLYHTGSEVLGILIARASGQSLGDFLRERLFAPLGMHDTGFHVPAEKLHRLPPTHTQGASGALAIHDAQNGRWATPPTFLSGGGGLVSTVDDYFAFCRMLLRRGKVDSERILSPAAVALMTVNHLTPDQQSAAAMILEGNYGWGFGVAVCTRRDALCDSPGRFGWYGGMGTAGFTDPAEDFIGIVMTQRLMDSPAPPKVFQDFWTTAYQAFGD